MRLEHYNLEKLKREILEIVARHLDLKKYKVFFFGSRVSGRGDERSDIDIGIEGQEAIHSSVLSDIAEDLAKIPTLYKIEVVDFTSADGNFKQVAKADIEPLN